MLWNSTHCIACLGNGNMNTTFVTVLLICTKVFFFYLVIYFILSFDLLKPETFFSFRLWFLLRWQYRNFCRRKRWEKFLIHLVFKTMDFSTSDGYVQRFLKITPFGFWGSCFWYAFYKNLANSCKSQTIEIWSGMFSSRNVNNLTVENYWTFGQKFDAPIQLKRSTVAHETGSTAETHKIFWPQCKQLNSLRLMPALRFLY